MQRSELLALDLRVPLGLLIEEADDGTIVVQGALPGYSAAASEAVEPGDLIRAVSGYREVIGDAPMWQQMVSYTPVGKLALKRLIFRTEGANFADVRDAIASHRQEDGGNGVVTLVLEKAMNSSTPSEGEVPSLEPLQDVIRRDLQRKPVTDESFEKELTKLSAAERAQRLLDLGFDPPPAGSE